jgi:hypothetical protein
MGQSRQALCTETAEVKIDYVPLQRGKRDAVLQIESCGVFLVVLRARPSNEWQHLGTIPLYGSRSKPEIRLQSLIRSDEQEIVVRSYVTDSGSGFFQSNMLIIKAFGDHLQIVFNEPEQVRFHVPTAPDKPSPSFEQESVFSFQPDSRPHPTAAMRITEQQGLRQGNHNISRTRAFFWEPELRIFQSSDLASPDGRAQTDLLPVFSPRIK